MQTEGFFKKPAAQPASGPGALFGAPPPAVPVAVHADPVEDPLARVDDMCKSVNVLLQQAAEFGARLKTARKTLEVTKTTLTRLRFDMHTAAQNMMHSDQRNLAVEAVLHPSAEE